MDYQRAKELDTTNQFGIQQKLSVAKKRAKENSRKDYYSILGLDSKATEKDIKKAYRKLALKWHPDRNNETEEQRLKAEKVFKDINEANTVLSDPEKKKQYDLGFDPNNPESGMSGGAGMNVDPTQIFQMFSGMGGMPGGATKMEFTSMGGGMPGGMGGGFGGEDIFKMFAQA